ncbi:hypothetical protein B7995_10505 [Staphylococcus aureus]|nr:hypothetical protein [Staphylococcus aureus]ORO02065.1 hypothetical protein B8A05_08460 [Staphylococcus aureus]ORO13246.1 hypothetical protein B8A01_11240 [Staphylococcus aureus]ORO30059.1 hypothetical protein B7995_10505 [Staphylococcus aureus]
MIFSQNLFRRPTPTYIVCRNWESNFSLLGPTPQLALPVEFLFEILYVGAHPQLAHYCKLTFRQLLCWGP